MDKQVVRAPRRRREHSAEFKRELVARSLEPGVSVAAIAMDSGINANLLFGWRRRHLHSLAQAEPVAAQRDRELREDPGRLVVPQPMLGPGLYDDSAFAGRLAPQPRLADGSRLDNRVGYRHALLLRRGLRVRLPVGVDCALVDDEGVQV